MAMVPPRDPNYSCASAIATLDVRHFSVLELEGAPSLYPRDGTTGH